MSIRLLCLALVLLSSLSVLSQTRDRERLTNSVFRNREALVDEVKSMRWRKGNFYISPVLGLRNFGYDNNVFSTQENRVDDISLAPEIGLQSFYKLNANWYWQNRVVYDYLYYADLDNLRGSEYAAESRFHGMFKRLYLEAGAGYNKDRQRLTSEIDARVTSDRIRAQVKADILTSARSQLTFNLTWSSLEYDEGELVGTNEEGLFQALERDDLRLRSRFHYKKSEHFWPFIEAEAREFSFDSVDNPRDGTTFNGLFVGARTHGHPRLVFEGRIGVQALDFNDATRTDANNQVTSIDLDDTVVALNGYVNYKLSRRYYVLATGLRTPIFSLSERYAYFLSQKATTEVGYETRRKIRIGPEIMVGLNDYKEGFQPTDLLREDELLGLNLNVTFPLRRIFEWRLSGGYLERKSNLDGASDDGYQISSTITYKLDR